VRLDKVDPPVAALVTWLDASMLSGWFGSRDEIIVEPLKMKTLGWLIHRDKNIVVLAMTFGEYKSGELLIIPAGCVQEINLLPPEDNSQ
jgi:hypothetical protein